MVSQSSDVRYANAQFNLGSVHANGKGVDKDETEAKYWYCKSAEQVYTNVQCHLRLVLCEWKRQKIDGKSFVHRYCKAIELGNAVDQYIFENYFSTERASK